LNSKIVSIKRFSAFFLAIVLIAGTINALYFPSFMKSANAQSEPPYYYETDEYTRYATDKMANEYNIDDEYKPQSAYYNDNNNYKFKDSKSIDIKKIKCNNINSNLNGIESTTDINGLLGLESATAHGNEEGGDLSANAYGNNGYKNNDNFDLNCININDNEGGQGITGQAGPIGPIGPAGPPGITQLNDDNTYQIADSFLNNLTTSNPLGQTFCDTGDFVINGGYRMLAISGPLEEAADLVVATDRPILDPFGAGWEVEIIVTSDDPTSDALIFYNVHAICFDNPPLRP
jgi:hypothetical protein